MDIVDEASSVIAMLQEQREASIRREAAAIPKGYPGYCNECGQPSGRLVLGVCAPCRDLLEKLNKKY